MRSRTISVHLYRKGWLFCLVVASVMLAAMAWIPAMSIVTRSAQWIFVAFVLSIGAFQFVRHPPKCTIALMHGRVDWKYGFLAWWNPADGPAALAGDDEMEAPSTWSPALVTPWARWRLALATTSRALWVLTVPLSTMLSIDGILALFAGLSVGVTRDAHSPLALGVIAAAPFVVLLSSCALCELLLRLSTTRMGLPGVPRPVAHRAALHAFSKTAGFMHPDTGRVHHATP